MPEKTVAVEVKLGEKFKAVSQLGNHTVYVDQPVALGGTDAGPNPLEILALSLGGCICAVGRIVANQQRISLRGMIVRVQGTLDTDVLLGKRNDKPAGFPHFDAEVEIDADFTPEEKDAFIHEVDARCPVSHNLQNPTGVTIRLKE